MTSGKTYELFTLHNVLAFLQSIPVIYPMAALLLAAIVYIIWSGQHDRTNRFDFWDLLMETSAVDGQRRASVPNFSYIASSAVLNGMVVYLLATRAMTEGYLTIYCVSVFGPLTAKVIFQARAMPTVGVDTRTVHTEVTESTRSPAPKPPEKGDS